VTKPALLGLSMLRAAGAVAVGDAAVLRRTGQTCRQGRVLGDPEEDPGRHRGIREIAEDAVDAEPI
jgi:hypothetical protein